MISMGGTPVLWSNRSMPVVKMAPMVICPSTPMFQRPAEKVISTPAVVSNNGDQEISTDTRFAHEPKAPRKMLP